MGHKCGINAAIAVGHAGSWHDLWTKNECAARQSCGPTAPIACDRFPANLMLGTSSVHLTTDLQGWVSQVWVPQVEIRISWRLMMVEGLLRGHVIVGVGA